MFKANTVVINYTLLWYTKWYRGDSIGISLQILCFCKFSELFNYFMGFYEPLHDKAKR